MMIPSHHSENKEELSKRVKHKVAIILGSATCFQVWESNRGTSSTQVRQDPGNQHKLDNMLEEDAAGV